MKLRLTTQYLFLLLALLVSGISSTAYALDLQSAKSQGLVGEQANGYLGTVQPAAGVQALVNDINSKRKAHYQEIARRNGTSLQVVEALAGKKAIDLTPPGQFVRDSSGNWLRK